MLLSYLHVLLSHYTEQKISSLPPFLLLAVPPECTISEQMTFTEKGCNKVTLPQSSPSFPHFSATPSEAESGYCKWHGQISRKWALIWLTSGLLSLRQLRTGPSRQASELHLPNAQKASFQLNHFLSSGLCLHVPFSLYSTPPAPPLPPPATHCRPFCQILIVPFLSLQFSH